MFKRSNLPIALGVAGLLAAWFYARRQSQQLSGVLSLLAHNPAPLQSRQIGIGYVDPITGSHGLAPFTVDANGDVSAPLGTDILLPAIDPQDPSLGTGIGPGMAGFYA